MATEYMVKGVAVIVDDADIPLVSGFSWSITPNGYAVCEATGRDGRKRAMGMHRLILGDPDSPTIDHINRDKLDNRRANLRPATFAENNRNTPIRKGKSSRYRGVSWNEKACKWQVVLRIDGRLKWCGMYESEDEAGAVAAPHFHGIAA